MTTLCVRVTHPAFFLTKSDGKSALIKPFGNSRGDRVFLCARALDTRHEYGPGGDNRYE